MNSHIDQVQSAINQWQINGSIEEVTKGYSGAWVFIIDTGNEKFILKRDTSKRKFLHKVLNFLAENNFVYTSRVIPVSENGETTYYDGEKYWDLLTFTPGKEISLPIDILIADSIGDVIGQFHNILKDFPVDDDTKFDETLNEIISKDRLGMWTYLSNNNINLLKQWEVYDLASQFVDLAKRVYKEFLNKVDWVYLESNLPKSVVHRDLYPEHVYFEGDQVSGIIDFGGAKYSRRVDDFYRMILEFSKNDTTIISTISNSYQKHIQLTDIEIQNMKEMMLLGYVRGGFWMLERALEFNDDFSSYPLSLKQRLEDDIEGIKKTIELDVSSLIKGK